MRYVRPVPSQKFSAEDSREALIFAHRLSSLDSQSILRAFQRLNFIIKFLQIQSIRDSNKQC